MTGRSLRWLWLHSRFQPMLEQLESRLSTGGLVSAAASLPAAAIASSLIKDITPP